MVVLKFKKNKNIYPERENYWFNVNYYLLFFYIHLNEKNELEILFPLLEKNGILIIDDYGFWKGARKAVDEYLENKDVTMFKIDFTGRMIINSK